jgi:hypothetical protein
LGHAGATFVVIAGERRRNQKHRRRSIVPISVMRRDMVRPRHFGQRWKVRFKVSQAVFAEIAGTAHLASLAVFADALGN